jgi:hypothetical protein
VKLERTLVDTTDRMVLYHSANDCALKLASILFDSVRAGARGIDSIEIDRIVADRMQILDASAVAAGLTRHSLHVDSADVINDLYYLFQEIAPDMRHGLRPVALSNGRWCPLLMAERPDGFSKEHMTRADHAPGIALTVPDPRSPRSRWSMSSR